jgi:hypothetical protein
MNATQRCFCTLRRFPPSSFRTASLFVALDGPTWSHLSASSQGPVPSTSGLFLHIVGRKGATMNGSDYLDTKILELEILLALTACTRRIQSTESRELREALARASILMPLILTTSCMFNLVLVQRNDALGLDSKVYHCHMKIVRVGGCSYGARHSHFFFLDNACSFLLPLLAFVLLYSEPCA